VIVVLEEERELETRFLAVGFEVRRGLQTERDFLGGCSGNLEKAMQMQRCATCCKGQGPSSFLASGFGGKGLGGASYHVHFPARRTSSGVVKALQFSGKLLPSTHDVNPLFQSWGNRHCPCASQPKVSETSLSLSLSLSLCAGLSDSPSIGKLCGEFSHLMKSSCRLPIQL
jgi:hypothetical protein